MKSNKMQELHIKQNEEIMAKLPLPTTYEQIRGKLPESFKGELYYTNHDGKSMNVFEQLQVKLVYEDWQKFSNPAQPLILVVRSRPILNHLGQPSQTNPTMKDFYSKPHDPPIPVSGESRKIPDSFFGVQQLGMSTVPTSPQIERQSESFKRTKSFITTENSLYPIFFSDVQIPCFCTKQIQVKNLCDQCKGSLFIEVTSGIQSQIEQILQRKIGERFNELKKIIYQKWGKDINSIKEFGQVHTELVNSGKLIPKSKLAQNIKQQPQDKLITSPPSFPMQIGQNFGSQRQGEQIQQQQQVNKQGEQINISRLPLKSPNKDNARRNSTFSTKSIISNQSSNIVNNDMFNVDQDNLNPRGSNRIQNNRSSQIRIPTSGRPSDGMNTSQKYQSIGGSQTINNNMNQSKGALVQSSMSGLVSQSMIVSKQAQFSALLVGNVEPQMQDVEPHAAIYFNATITNNGSYKWPDSVKLTRIDDNSHSQALRPLEPQEKRMFRIQFQSPSQLGPKTTEWRLNYEENGEKMYFGPRFKVKIDVQNKSMELKQKQFEEYITDLHGGNYSDIQLYVVKKLSQNPEIDFQSFSSILCDDLKANENLFSEIFQTPEDNVKKQK